MKLIISILLSFALMGCSSSKKLKYSFFIAGHTYGNPSERANNIGLYKPFKSKTEFINNQENMKYVFLFPLTLWNTAPAPLQAPYIQLRALQFHRSDFRHAPPEPIALVAAPNYQE